MKNNKYLIESNIKSYKASVGYRSFSSQGNVHRIYSITEDRVCELLSNIERNAFVLADIDPEIIGIKEQVKLDLAKTRKIAKSLGIKHPRNPETKEDVQMTTDLLLTRRKNGKVEEFAVYIKSSNKLDHWRTKQKREIERRYWKEKGTQFVVITEKDISLEEVRMVNQLLKLIPDENYTKYLSFFKDKLIQSPLTLHDFFKSFEEANDLEVGYSFYLFKWLLRLRKLPFDLKKRFDPYRKYSYYIPGGELCA